MPRRIWQLFNRSDITAVKDFLARWEFRNVNLSRYFFKDRGLFKLPKTGPLFLCKPEKRVTAMLLKGPYGLFLPIFSEDFNFSDTGIPANPEDFRTLMGTGAVIRSAELLFPGRIKHTVNYRLMSMSPRKISFAEHQGSSAAASPEGISIRRASTADLKALFPLQQAYELEEVIFDPSTFNPLLCLENLRRQLKNEVVFLAERNGVPVAKAGTNARGLFFAQLGGIYTHPGLRNRGISRALTTHLVQELKAMGLSTCLYAKPDNSPALRVYRNCGMEDRGDFRISYLYI